GPRAVIETQRWAVSVDPGPGAQRRLCQAPGVSQRLNRATAPIEKPAAVDGRSGELRYPATREKRHRFAAPRPLLGALGLLRQCGFGRGRLNPAGALRFAFDAMARDEIEHQVGAGGGGLNQTLPGGAEQSLERVRVQLDAGNDLTAVE